MPAGISATIKLHVEDAKGTEIGCVSFDVNVKDESSIHSFFGGVEASQLVFNAVCPVFDDTAPFARLVLPKARGAPTDPRAQPQWLGRVPSPQELAVSWRQRW